MRSRMNEWERILREKWYSRREPDENVVDLVSFLTARHEKLRILDLGCGAGRNQLYLAKRGFEAHGVDISNTGLILTQGRLKEQDLEVYLAKCDMKSLPYVESCFDAVICLHTIYHQKLEGIKKTVIEIRRVLKRKGLLLMNFLSERTYSYGKGVEIEIGTFVEREGVEKGVLHHFSGREEIERLLKEFGTVNLEFIEREVEGKLRSRWIATAWM
jgi:ubiquinone/menaquinone biosynthesis C-methylase UbiE